MPYDDARSAAIDQVAKRVADFQEFVNALASLVTCFVAGFATLAVVEIFVSDVVRCEAERSKDIFGGLVGCAALGAYFPDEALGEHAFQGSRDQEGFDAHVNEAGYRAGRVVGMEGGEDEVTGEGSLNGDLGGFGVSSFTHQDAIGVLPEERPEEASESESDSLVDGNLYDAVDFVFDRILCR